MERRSFLKILPGLFAAKTIAKELATPVPVVRGGIYDMMSNSNKVTYQPLTLAKFREVFNEIYYPRVSSKSDDAHNIRIWTGEEGLEMINKAIKDNGIYING